MMKPFAFEAGFSLNDLAGDTPMHILAHNGEGWSMRPAKGAPHW